MARNLAGFIPQRPEELTTEWLTEKLGHDATVIGFTTGSPGSGVGFSGITTKVDLEWDRDDPALPQAIVAKFPTDLAHRGLTEVEGGYEREIWFYEGMGSDMPLPIPRHLHAEMDPGQTEAARRRTARMMNRAPAPVARFISKRAHKLIRATKRRYVLLIEYVPDARVTPLDRAVPPEDLAAIMAGLARMHAHYWRDPRLGSDLSTSYDTASQNYKFLQAGYDLWADQFFERTPGLEDRHRNVTDWAHRNLDAVLRRLNEPYTLIHGDARTDNMLFRDDGSLVMIDFGSVSAAPPGWDVAYALSGAVEPGAGARAILEEMAVVYHDALAGAGVDEYPLETLRRDIDLSMCFLGHRQVLTAAVMEGGFDTAEGGQANLGDTWMRKIIDLLPAEPPSLES